MKTKCFRCSFLFLLTFFISLFLCISVSAQGEEARDLSIVPSLADGAAFTLKIDGQEQTGLTAQVKVGALVEVTVKPNTGYLFEQWTATPLLTALADPSATSISFSMPDTEYPKRL